MCLRCGSESCPCAGEKDYIRWVGYLMALGWLQHLAGSGWESRAGRFQGLRTGAEQQASCEARCRFAVHSHVHALFKAAQPNALSALPGQAQSGGRLHAAVQQPRPAAHTLLLLRQARPSGLRCRAVAAAQAELRQLRARRAHRRCKRRADKRAMRRMHAQFWTGICCIMSPALLRRIHAIRNCFINCDPVCRAPLCHNLAAGECTRELPQVMRGERLGAARQAAQQPVYGMGGPGGGAGCYSSGGGWGASRGGGGYQHGHRGPHSRYASYR